MNYIEHNNFSQELTKSPLPISQFKIGRFYITFQKTDKFWCYPDADGNLIRSFIAINQWISKQKNEEDLKVATIIIHKWFFAFGFLKITPQ